jgi:hypothetical protein
MRFALISVLIHAYPSSQGVRLDRELTDPMHNRGFRIYLLNKSAVEDTTGSASAVPESERCQSLTAKRFTFASLEAHRVDFRFGALGRTPQFPDPPSPTNEPGPVGCFD